MVVWSPLLSLVSLTLSVVLSTAAAQDPTKGATVPASTPLVEDIPNAYIVEFADGYNIDSLLADLKGNAIDTVKRKDLKYKLFNGASFDIKGNSKEEVERAVERISGHSKVKKIWPVRKVTLPDDKFTSIGFGSKGSFDVLQDGAVLKRQSKANNTYNLHMQTQVDRLHAEGFTGKGIKIALIDSGVDYKHPLLGGCFGKGCKVSFGYDIIGDDMSQPGKFPDDDPMDCAGHGTHVAGIVGANPSELGFVGVAPDAELGAYKALNCIGYSTNEMLISAFNMAYEAGADIISSSTGIEGGWADDAWSSAVSRIVDAGVPVVIAAGNSGEQGLWRPSSPSAGRGVTSVASTDNTEFTFLFLAGTYKLDDGDPAKFPWIAGEPALGNISLPLRLLTNTSGAAVDACQPLAEGVTLSANTVYLVAETGACRHQSQIDNMADKGAKNVIIYARTDRPVKQSYLSGPKANFGVTTQTQGKAWVNALQSGSNITVTTLEPVHSPGLAEHTPNTATGGYTSYWSSWGPDWELFVTPNVAAPGGEIVSTYPLSLGSYAVASGTSMACPFAAGALALIAQKRKVKDSGALRSLLASTSKQLVHHDGQKADPQNRLHSVLQGGAGLLQVFDASEAKGLLSTAFISFNDTEHYKDVTFSLKNTGKREATYELGHRPAATVYALDNHDPGYPQAFPVELAPAAAVAELSFSKKVVRVPAGRSVSITVKATPPTANIDLSRQPFYSGFITLNGTNGDALVLQYQGLAGAALRKAPIIAEGLNDLNIPRSYIATTTNRFPYPINNDTVFRIPRPAIPPVANDSIGFPQARVSHGLGTRRMEFRVVPLEHGGAIQTEDWHGLKTLPTEIYGAPYELIPRGSTWRTFEGLMADGATAPEGKYKIAVAALRLFGDWNKEEDWHVMELEPSFTIRYT
ncbi:hypothetical protein MCOR25_011070 [Pyricularia grisea]|uniref:Minor extracellular protease vpr n=1 Tax=Pyricularia grisea TaxID=148305 RepID=A0A6P8B1N6_PYRGI|nr:uncharacterized protein PgNI_07074 [Pyricularia grisea]KAI6344746.1 hypothetical protein MCOR25_011070 [Pyricularia grisea]TLD08756.1 hypothetical protein PgNI_07074 [Pyricularia grisea]